ncbi:collagen alpha-3(VI) chain [Amia ocellicauda]|uniref:collagen alpha-3(VI) chain n=1 Tax=Amia ocellicauda TaxID=2972642 RepID=UPI003464361E
MTDFVQRVVENLNVDENKDRVAVVQYSNDPAANFYLNTYSRKDEVIKRIQGLTHKGGRPLNTGAALQFVKDNVFTAPAGSRRTEGVPQIVILLTGGKSRDDARGSAIALKGAGIVPFTIGTRNADTLELQTISYVPDYALSVPDFGDLESIQQHLISSVKRIPRQQRPDTPIVIVETEAGPRDVVFLLDGSDTTRTGFPAMRDFVQRVVENLNVDENKDRVAVVQYSNDPAANFYLNTYSRKDEVINRIQGLRHKGGRPLNTGAALQFVKDNVFTAPAGSRRTEGVPQILILLTAGRSRDDVRSAVTTVKGIGVVSLVIGMRSADTLELQTIAHEPRYAFSVPDFTDLLSVQPQMLSAMMRFAQQKPPESPTVIDTGKRDVVFLLDGSDTTRNGFPAMQAFVERVVEKLDVDENKDRVAVVQYSNDPAAHFYLNTYSTKDDVINTIRRLRHKGGRPLNTGAALQFVQNNVFTGPAGSRRPEGVPQILILLSGGRSRDDIRGPVTALKEYGVVPFGIGTSNADTLELQTISYEPRYALSVPGFSDLSTIEQQLLSLVTRVPQQKETETTPVLAETSMVKRDIVFLLDGSDDARSRFPAIREFVERVVENFDVKENKDRVAVVQYSNDAVASFYLNTHSSKESVLSAVRNLKPKGGRPHYTGAALQFVKANVFTPAAGSRRLEGVPQILRVVENLNVDENKDRVAVVQYSNDPAANFYLNTYSRKDEVINRIQGLRHKGGRPLNTGAALQFVKNNIFTAPAGSRRTEGVPQILILLTGGRSRDDVRSPAVALKGAGVISFSIGVRNAKTSELQNISYSPSMAFSVPDFDNLEDVAQKLSRTVEGKMPERELEPPDLFGTETEYNRADIVFMLDGSDDTRNGFPAMRDFVQRVVENLNVEEKNDRVAVVQYSDDQVANFYLNTYTKKDDVINGVKLLIHKGGRPLNTGAAFQFVQNNVFTASAGSRRLEGVPQLLIVLTGGKSRDDAWKQKI